MLTVLRALAEPRRIEILRFVGRKELPAGAIAAHFRVTRPAVSQHLKVLADAGLLVARREGTRRFYRVRHQGFEPLRSFLEEFWDLHLSTLKAAVEQDAPKRGVHAGRRTRRDSSRSLHQR